MSSCVCVKNKTLLEKTTQIPHLLHRILGFCYLFDARDKAAFSMLLKVWLIK